MSATRRPRRPVPWRQIVGYLVVGLSIISAVRLYQVSATLEHENACQAAFNVQFERSITDRAVANDTWIDAQVTFLRALGAGATPAEKATAYRRYLDALAVLRAAKLDNPLPPQSCGGGSSPTP